MKRIISILPIACALLLAACNITPSGNGGNGSNGGNSGNGSMPAPAGNVITAEQASALLTEASAHVMEESFVAPTKFSLTARMESRSKKTADAEVVTGVMEEKMEYDQEAKCGYMGMTYTEDGEPGEMHQWFWTANGKYYRAYSESLTDFSEGDYEEMSADEFDEFVAMATEEFVPTKEDFATMDREMQNYIISANAYSDPTTNLPEGASVTFAKNQVAAEYRSTGAGNLSVDLNIDVDANFSVTEEGTTVSGRVAAKFDMDIRMDGYLPIYEDIDYTMLSDADGEYMNIGGKITSTYNWGTCNFQAPDLSKFPAPNAED